MAQTKLLVTLKQYVDSHIERLHSLIDALELKHGKDGLHGKDGRDGKNGKDGKSIKGDQGERGLAGRDGADGKDGLDGEDGVSVVDVRIDIDNHLVLTLSNDNEIDAGSLASISSDKDSPIYRTNTRVVEAPLRYIDYLNSWSVAPVTVRTGAVAEYNSGFEFNEDEFSFGNKNYEYGVAEFNASEYSGSIAGSIMKYTYTNGVLYRFVPDDGNPRYDAFYRDYQLTQLVVRKGSIVLPDFN
jgi:hypothetical protein